MNQYLKLLAALFLFTNAFSQKISGIILDTKQNPIAFASIVSNDGISKMSDEKGAFSLKINSGTKIISISATGFKTKK